MNFHERLRTNFKRKGIELESCAGRVNPRRLRVARICGAGARTSRDMRAARNKKFFVRVTECWLSACEWAKKVNATQNLWYKGAEEGSYANRNTLLGQKLFHYVREGRTLNGLLSS